MIGDKIGLIPEVDQVECRGGPKDGWRFSKESFAKRSDSPFTGVRTSSTATYMTTGELTTDGAAEIFQYIEEPTHD